MRSGGGTATTTARTDSGEAMPGTSSRCSGAVTKIALGWRVHSWWAVVVAVRGPAAAPAVLARERVTLLDDPAVQEAYHAAVRLPLDEAPAFIASVQEDAAEVASVLIARMASSLGPIATVGVVGGDRKLPDLARILAKHALLHAAERNLYEQAVVQGAAQAGLRVTALPATGNLLDDASRILGVELEPLLHDLGDSIGKPWQKDHREATAAALVALDALS